MSGLKVTCVLLAALLSAALASTDSTRWGITNPPVDRESEETLEIVPLDTEALNLKWRRLLEKASRGEVSAEDMREIVPGSSWVHGLVRKLLQDKIKGGKDAPEGRFPYMVSLRHRVSGNHKCGGILIDGNWVLTAAHCVDPERPDSAGQNPTVVAGTIHVDGVDSKGGEEIFVSETIIHPDYNGNTHDGFDIALLRLERPTKVTVFARLPDPDAKYFPATRFVALGWGIDGQRLHNTLQIIDQLEMITAEKCQKFSRRVGSNKGLVILDSMICMFSMVEDTCKGDSGGPLLDARAPNAYGDVLEGKPQFDVVSGITSFGNGDCTDGKPSPGIYTLVPYFVEWIQTTMASPKKETNNDTTDISADTSAETNEEEDEEDNGIIVIIPSSNTKDSAQEKPKEIDERCIGRARTDNIFFCAREAVKGMRY